MRAWLGISLLVGIAVSAHAQLGTGLRMLTNKEALLTITATNTSNVTLRIYNPPMDQFVPLLTFRSTGVNNHVDTAAPYLDSRFYASRFAAPNAFLGDHITTTNGDLIIQPVTHASFVMSWNGKTIYNDPAGSSSLYTAFPKADLILISHDHNDHINSTTINSVTNPNTVIITSLGPYNTKMTAQQRSISRVLTYGGSTTAIGITVEAVPAYNGNHPYGTNNAYVLTIGGKRILMTGDCGAGPELRSVPNIDFAFICMNGFTMDVATAASVVRDMRPKVVFPYHFGSLGGGPTHDVQMFKRLVGSDRGIEVRLRKWY